MADRIRRVEYFYTTIDDRPGEGLRILAALKKAGCNLAALTVFPSGPGKAQFDFFPEDAETLRRAASQAGLSLVGPKPAFLVQGEDRTGAILDLHARLAEARINVHAANGTTDGQGHFAYILWVKSEQYDAAARVLGV